MRKLSSSLNKSYALTKSLSLLLYLFNTVIGEKKNTGTGFLIFSKTFKIVYVIFSTKLK